jgi:hypothetical protein
MRVEISINNTTSNVLGSLGKYGLGSQCLLVLFRGDCPGTDALSVGHHMNYSNYLNASLNINAS